MGVEIGGLGGNEGGVSLLQKAEIILTDAQIKALPTIPVEIVPPPGANKVIQLVGCTFSYNTSAGAYTLPGTPGNILVAINIPPGTASLGVGYNTTGTLDTTTPQLRSSFWGATFIDIAQNAFPSQAEVVNKNLGVYSDASADFTGGNAANTLKVTVYYTIVEL